jgi:hypothetical protein
MCKFVVALICSAHLCHAGLVGRDENSAASDLDKAVASFLLAYAPQTAHVPRSIAKTDRMALHSRAPVHRMMAERNGEDRMSLKTDASRRATLIKSLMASSLLPVGIAQAKPNQVEQNIINSQAPPPVWMTATGKPDFSVLSPELQEKIEKVKKMSPEEKEGYLTPEEYDQFIDVLYKGYGWARAGKENGARSAK